MAGANELPNVNKGDDGKEKNDVIVDIEVEMGKADVASTSGQEVDDVIAEATHDWADLAQSIEKKRLDISRDSNELITKIPKVPEGHGYGDRDLYVPSIISIGPYHRGKPRLRPMEMLKWKCFDRLMNRPAGTKRSLESCINELRTLEMEARSHYSASTEELLSRDFVEMMLLDACFILEYCTSIREGSLSDLVEKKIWMDTAIRNDLLLLENQLPFSVVQLTHNILISQSPVHLMELVQTFCQHVSPINTNEPLGKPMHHHLLAQHLLQIYHWFLFSNTRNINRDSSSTAFFCPDISTTNLFRPEKPICTVSSATFLEESGIKLRRKMRMTDTLLDANFRNGVMEITPLFIDAFTVSQFRNLIAFEKSDPYIEPQAIAFAQFMDYIINTSKDVALLRKKGIVEHALGSDEEIATVFNQLTSGALEYRTEELERMYQDVDKYCKVKHHHWRAVLMRNYFGSPWAAISLVAAVILLSLTFLQTFFSMYPYFRPRQ